MHIHIGLGQANVNVHVKFSISLGTIVRTLHHLSLVLDGPLIRLQSVYGALKFFLIYWFILYTRKQRIAVLTTRSWIYKQIAWHQHTVSMLLC